MSGVNIQRFKKIPTARPFYLIGPQYEPFNCRTFVVLKLEEHPVWGPVSRLPVGMNPLRRARISFVAALLMGEASLLITTYLPWASV